MKKYLSLQGLSTAFDLVWKIWLAMNLAWIAQSLHVIATNVQTDEQTQGEFDPNQKEGTYEFDQSQTCPRPGPVT